MKNVLKSRWVGVLLRYLLAPAVVFLLAVYVTVAVGSARPELGGEMFIAQLAAPLVTWTAAAAFDRRRLRWRVLLVWAPAILVIVAMLGIELRPNDHSWDETDGRAMAYMLLLGVFGVTAAFSLLGTFAAMLYRPTLASAPAMAKDRDASAERSQRAG